MFTSSLTRWAGEATELSAFDEQLSKLIDVILVSIQNLSKYLHTIPQTTDETSWLIQEDINLSNGIKSLHIPSISALLREAFTKLACLELDEPYISSVSMSLVAMALPIVQQYANIARDRIVQYAKHHLSTSRLSYVLAKNFVQIASQGFCTPQEESEAQEGMSEKLEAGTGLGEGEGAENISKD